MAKNISHWMSEYSGNSFETKEEAEAYDERVIDAVVEWLGKTMDDGWLNKKQIRGIADKLIKESSDLRGVISQVE